MSHRISRTWKDRLRRAVPFGLGDTKPHHYRDMVRVAWKNRDNLPYAWSVLSRGVCDGCALGVSGFRDWTIDGVHLCITRLNLLRLNTMPPMDASRLDDVEALRRMDNAELRELGRLPWPMLRQRGERGFRRISWDDAYARIARRIRDSRPERIALYLTSRGVTNETYYVAQKVARFLGTNNVDNAARLCHSPSTGALKAAIGVAATTCSYRDWWSSDLLIFFGSNPANDQPVSLKYIHEAKKHGTRVAIVNPYREPGMDLYWVPSNASSALFGTDVMDYWFPVSAGGDIPFLYGVMKIIVENGWYDHDFVENHTVGFDELRAAVAALTWEELEEHSGLTRQGMYEFAEMVRDAGRGVVIWSMGVTQHGHGGDNVRMIANLALSQGWVGREGCGLMPIRGHSGVQGGAEMGAYATAFPGGKTINEDNARALADEYGFDVPARPGLPATEMVEAAARGELDLLYCLGGNFLRALPDPNYVAAAMANVPMRVHQDIIVTDQMLIDAKEEVLLLPAKTRYEQEGGGTETTTERRVLFSPEIPRQVGEARAEWAILREVAAAVDPERAPALGCETAEAIREEIARVVPSYEGIQYLRRAGDQFQYGGAHLCAGNLFPTADGKAHFGAPPVPRHRPSPDTFIVTTRRGKQFNTLIYAEVDPLTGAARDAVFMNADDAAGLHLRDGDRVALQNEHGRLEGRIQVVAIARRNLQVHWPEGNVLIPSGVVDGTGGVPEYNADVRIEKVGER